LKNQIDEEIPEEEQSIIEINTGTNPKTINFYRQ